MEDIPVKQSTTRADEIEDLVLKARSDDKPSMEKLIELFQNKLYRFCLYLTSDKDIASDICQDTFVKVLTKLSTLKEPKSFYSWIVRMAKNLYFDHIKSPSVKGSVGLEALENEGLDETASETMFLTQALSKLEKGERLILILIDYQGYSYGEAAEIIGISEEAITSRIHRIRKDLLEKLKKR